MKRRMKIISVIHMLCAVTVLIAGCAGILVGAGVGAGAIAYIKGESIRTYDFPIREVALAAQKTFLALEISATGTSIGEIESTLEGAMKDESKVVIKMNAKTAKTTVVKVRVGVMGNEDISQRIHDEILKILKSGTI